jgi:hypothetical protein
MGKVVAMRAVASEDAAIEANGLAEVAFDTRWIIRISDVNEFGWISIRVHDLKATRANEKRSYWLGHNGERFSSSKDLATLRNNHPDVMARLEAMLPAQRTSEAA